jgi:hypothetical protein
MKRYEGLSTATTGTTRTGSRRCCGWDLADRLSTRSGRAVRDLLRHRSRLVRNRTARLLTVSNLIARETGRRTAGNELKRLTIDQIGASACRDEPRAVELARGDRPARREDLEIRRWCCAGRAAPS